MPSHRRARMLAAALAGVAVLPITSAHAGNPVAVLRDGGLVQVVDTDVPGTVVRSFTLTGATSGEVLVGLDREPAAGTVYALGIDPSIDRGTLYTANLDT